MASHQHVGTAALGCPTGQNPVLFSPKLFSNPITSYTVGAGAPFKPAFGLSGAFDFRSVLTVMKALLETTGTHFSPPLPESLP
jgi:hypothetical protein